MPALKKLKIHKSKFKNSVKDFFFQKHRKGFTLIELMVTIAIIAILATVGAVVYSSAQKTARVSKRIQDLKSLHTAIELYKTSTGTYPINASAVALNAATGTTTVAALAPNYMPALPTDPYPPNTYWYQSDATGTNYKVRTGGSSSSGANTDMVVADYRTQFSMIDPHRDGTAATSVTDCTIEATSSANFSPTAWSFQTTNACNF